MKRSSVRPYVSLSVCYIDRQQQRLTAGLMLRAMPAGDIYRQQVPALSSNGARSTALSTKLEVCMG